MSYDYDGSLGVNLSAAIAHHKDAGEALSAAVDCDPNSEEHRSWIRAAHAHQKMSSDCIESYRRSAGIDDDHDVDEGDPESGKPTTQEERRRRAQRLRAQVGSA